MSDFVTLTCPNCGGKLEVTKDIDRFACGHCGVEHIVKRGGGIVALAPVEEAIMGIKTGVDKTASELAIKRLEVEISELYHFINTKKNQPKRKDNLFAVASVLIGIFTSCGGIIWVIYDASLWYTLLIGIILIIFGAIVLSNDTKKNKELSDKLNADIQLYSHLVSKKNKELEHHKKIVEIND